MFSIENDCKYFDFGWFGVLFACLSLFALVVGDSKGEPPAANQSQLTTKTTANLSQLELLIAQQLIEQQLQIWGSDHRRLSRSVCKKN